MKCVDFYIVIIAQIRMKKKSRSSRILQKRPASAMISATRASHGFDRGLEGGEAIRRRT
jgi:hypothetical protein